MGLEALRFDASDFTDEDIASLPDRPGSNGMTAAQLKARFDNIGKIMVALGVFNNLIDAMQSETDGDSGADNVAVTAVPGAAGSSVQAVLEALAAGLGIHIGAGGAAHAGATNSDAGFLTAAGKTLLDALSSAGVKDLKLGLAAINNDLDDCLPDGAYKFSSDTAHKPTSILVVGGSGICFSLNDTGVSPSSGSRTYQFAYLNYEPQYGYVRTKLYGGTWTAWAARFVNTNRQLGATMAHSSISVFPETFPECSVPILTYASELAGETAPAYTGWIAKKMSLTNFKTGLKAYFDTLYNLYVHPTTSGNKHVPSGGVSGNFLKWASDGVAAWASHGLTKSDVGLGNVTNDAQVKKLSASTAGNVPTWNGTTGDALADGWGIVSDLDDAVDGKLVSALAVKAVTDGINENVAAVVVKAAKNTDAVMGIETALAQMNPNQSARVDITSAAQVVALPKTAGQGPIFPLVKGLTAKQLLTYTPSTMAEWNVVGTGGSKGSGSLHLVADAGTDKVEIATTCKNSTKYGLLYNISATDLNGDILIPDVSALVSPTVTLTKNVGNNKATITTVANITSNNLLISLSAGNTDGKYVDLNSIRLFELPTGSQIETDFTNLTADQLNNMYPLFFGTQSAIAPRLRSVGKNLSNGKSELGEIDGTTGQNASSSTALRLVDYVKVLPNTAYTVSGTHSGGSALDSGRIYWYDNNKNFINYVGTITATSPANAAYLRFRTLRTTTYNFQVERNAVATTYEAYKDLSGLYTEPKTLYRVPNDTADTIEMVDGVWNHIKRVGVGALGSELASLNFTNVSWTKTASVTSHNDLSFETNAAGGLIKTFFTVGKTYKLKMRATISTAYTILNGTSPSLTLLSNASTYDTVIFKAVYTDLYIRLTNAGIASFTEISIQEVNVSEGDSVSPSQPLIGGTNAYYQLATPIYTPIASSGVLQSYPSGTIYAEHSLADAGLYDSGIAVLNTDFPIATIESLYKVDFATGVKTALDHTTAAVAGDGLSFTHAGLAAGDLVFFTYHYLFSGVWGENVFSFFDGTIVKEDTENGKFYKLGWSVTNGVPTMTATEVT